MAVGASFDAGDPFARCIGCCGAPIDGCRELDHDIGPSGAAMVEIRRELLGCLDGPDTDDDVDACSSESVDSRSVDLLIWIDDADDDA